jgi:uncharacterized membrane protein YgcG
MKNVSWPRLSAHRASARSIAPLAAGAAILTSLLVAAPAHAVIKVAVIGPQHVHSHQLTRDKEYPAMLQTLLGAEFMVGNFGDCCATILQGYPKQKETHPYLESGEAYPAVGGMNFKDSVKFMPDIVVIGPWGKHDTEIADQLYKGTLDAAKLQADFDELVTTYQKLPSKPQVIVLTPIPIPFGMPVGVTTMILLPAIKAVAAKYNLPVVDVYPAFLNHKELFKDETHITNDAGLHTLADMVFAVMKANPPGSAPAPSADAAAPAGADASASGGASGGSSGSATGGSSGGIGSGGSSGSGGATASGGAGATGGSSGSSNSGGSSGSSAGSNGSSSSGGSSGSSSGGSSAPAGDSGGSPSSCGIAGGLGGAPSAGSAFGVFALAGLAAIARRRRRR